MIANPGASPSFHIQQQRPLRDVQNKLAEKISMRPVVDLLIEKTGSAQCPRSPLSQPSLTTLDHAPLSNSISWSFPTLSLVTLRGDNVHTSKDGTVNDSL